MNLDALNKWLTLSANVGVLLGIIFLAYELRQNNELLQTEASTVYVQMRSNGIQSRGEDSDYLNAFIKASNGEELNQTETLILDFYNQSVFVNWEWEYDQYLNGTLNVFDQPPASRWLGAVERYPYMNKSWELHKNSFSTEFVQYMESEVFR